MKRILDEESCVRLVTKASPCRLPHDQAGLPHDQAGILHLLSTGMFSGIEAKKEVFLITPK
jgi:hypothetical protein